MNSNSGSTINKLFEKFFRLASYDDIFRSFICVYVYYRIEELKWAINKLMETARRLREKRTRSGAVELEGVEVQVQLTDNKSTIDDLIPKQVHLQH